MAKTWKVASLDGLKSDLVGLGHKVYFRGELERDGIFFLTPSDGVLIDVGNEAMITMSTKDVPFGRKVNKELKTLGYKTNIVTSRKKWLVVFICVDFEKYGF